MKLIVKKSLFDYELSEYPYDFHTGMEPILDFGEYDLWDEFSNGRQLSTVLVRSLYNDFIEVNKQTIKDSLTDRIEITSTEQLFKLFPISESVLEYTEDVKDYPRYGEFLDGYKVYVYPNTKNNVLYTEPCAREAMYSRIWCNNNIVCYSYDNVRKYYEWDELLRDLCHLSVYKFSSNKLVDDVKYDEGNTYEFILITDNESYRGVTNIFNSTIGACLTNYKTKTKTIFNRIQAVCFYTLLHSVCQKFYDEWADSMYVQDVRHKTVKLDGIDMISIHQMNDSIDEYNPYVNRFYGLCNLIENTDFAFKLIDNVLTNILT